ncbi:beta-actin [Pelomyxa schiedti]|nr:beta-actin [Pelomyxa schiedti]
MSASSEWECGSSDQRPSGIVVDNGSATTKAGFSGDDAPRGVFPTVVGHSGIPTTSSAKTVYAGDEAWSNRATLTLNYPVQRGMVTSWDDMEHLWRHIYSSELHVIPEDYPVLIAESPGPKENKERIAQIMFEKFAAPALYLTWQAVLALYASGKTTGTVVDTGGGITHFVPIYEGEAIEGTVTRMELAGCDLSQYLLRMLTERGYSFTTPADNEVLRDIKQKLCYVAADFQTELNKTTESPHCLDMTYQLPDGNTVTLGKERFTCPEALFQPSLVHRESPGFSEACYTSIAKADIGIRRDLYGNIVLSGGNSMFPGLSERLQKGVAEFAPSALRVKVFTPPERKYLCWIGGSIITSLCTFQQIWISHDDYTEKGPSIIHKKCPHNYP